MSHQDKKKTLFMGDSGDLFFNFYSLKKYDKTAANDNQCIRKEYLPYHTALPIQYRAV